MNRETKVREVTLNGIKIPYLTQAQLKEYYIKKTVMLWKCGTKYLLVDGKNWRDLYKAAGYNTDKLDMSYPMRWRDSDPKVDARFKAGDHAAWYYGGKYSLLGEPVWTSDVQKRVIMLAKQKLGD